MNAIAALSFVASLVLPSTPPGDEGRGPDLYTTALGALLDRWSGWCAEDASRQSAVPLCRGVAVEKTSYLEAAASLVAGAIPVAVLDDQGLARRFNAEGAFTLLRVFPARGDSTTLSVGINQYNLSYRPRRLFRQARFLYGLEGGARIHFRYDCEAGRFVVARVEEWGV